MQDYRARECQGHNILAVERFADATHWMVEYIALTADNPYGGPGDRVRLFLDDEGYQKALAAQKKQKIQIKRYAHVVEGHVVDFKPKKIHQHNFTKPGGSYRKP